MHFWDPMKIHHASISTRALDRAAMVRTAGMPIIKAMTTTTWTRGASG